jgi:hypothetical protein
MTATNGRPSSAAKYASDTAVDPDDASTTVVSSSIQPDVRRLVFEVELDTGVVRPG